MAFTKFSLVSLLFFFQTFPLTSALEFYLPRIGPEDTNRFIEVGGDAYISKHGIQFTPAERYMASHGNSGRATYIESLHLWSSGFLADFSTYFSFLIHSDSPDCYSDGLTFFLTPEGSSFPKINVTGGHGGYLDLTNNTSFGNESLADPVVAIEFDTCHNVWDPVGQHVGIDINSVQSVISVPWTNNMTLEVENYAWITYDSTAKNLTVTFTGAVNDEIITNSLSYVVDLRDILPERVTVGFSGATGPCFGRNYVKSWGFYSTLPESRIIEGNNVKNSRGFYSSLLGVAPYSPSSLYGYGASAPAPVGVQGGPSSYEAPPPSVPEHQNGGVNTGTRNKKLKIEIVFSCLSVVIFLLALLGYCFWKQKTKQAQPSELQLHVTMDNEFEKGSGARKFSYDDLLMATKNFSEEEKLGEGGFGSVYRGFLKDLNSFVAVKRVSKDSNQGLKEYASEVKIINQLRHRNLVKLIGWCHEKGDLLLVYEFMPHGSLDFHLFRERSLLPWEARYRIAHGLASALLYLHEEWEQCVVHRDIKSSNIMLDSSFNAKLGDFGLARLLDHGKSSQTTVIAGTLGYMAPECTITGKASKESDVYSYGIVALEIACGRKVVDFNAPANQVILLQWILELYEKGRLIEGADPKLGSDFVVEQMEHLMTVGLWCAHPDSASRPSIRQVLHFLNFELHLPNLPPKKPIKSYATTAFAKYSPSVFHPHNDGTDDDSNALQLSNPSSYITSSSGFTTSTMTASSSASKPRI